MADAVTARILVDTPTQTVVHLTCISDATGEAAVTKVTKANLIKCAGILTAGVRAATAAPASLEIAAVRWNIQGFTSVRLLWDHTAADLAMPLSGNGFEDFLGAGEVRGDEVNAVLPDPRSAGGTGNILLTSVGAAAGATYDITLYLRKSAA